jgi:AmmeMemoRadiSam system protein B
MTSISEIRPSPIAGVWYPGEPQQLAAEIDHFLEQAQIPQLDGEVIGLISPHAGYRYSGRTAAHAYRAVSGAERELVAVLSPLHAFHPAPVLTSAHRAYHTPLGTVPIDTDGLAELEEELVNQVQVGLTPVANDREHSLEIELPFLQRTLKNEFKLLPVMLRSQSAAIAQPLGIALARVLSGRSGLLVASTDLSHFYPVEQARQLDTEMLHQIENFDPEAVLRTEKTGTGFACGVAAVAAVLWAARELGADEVRILHYSTSADETLDDSSVVGYGAAVILKHT